MGIFGGKPSKEWSAVCALVLKRLGFDDPIEHEFVEKLPELFGRCIDRHNAELVDDKSTALAMQAFIDNFWIDFDDRFKKLARKSGKDEAWGRQWQEDLRILVHFSSGNHFRGVDDHPDFESMYMLEVDAQGLRRAVTAIIERYGVSGITLPRA